MNGSTGGEPVAGVGTRWRRAVARAGWTPPGTAGRAEVLLVVTVWAAILIPQVVESLTTAKGFVPITAGPVTPSPGVAAVTTVANGLIVLVCAVVVLLRLGTVELRRVPVLLALLAPWCVAAVQLFIAGRTPGPATLAFPAIVAAVWVLRPGPDVVRTVGCLTGLTAVISLGLGAFAPAAGRYPAETLDPEKWVGPAGVLAGVMPTGNSLGLYLVLGLPTVLTIRRPSLRWTALGAVLLALVWTSSRTSWVAAGVVILLLATVAWVRRPGVVAATGLALLAVAGVVIPFVVAEPTAFVNRAGFWIASLDAWRERVLTGFGADYYKRLAETPQNLGGFAYDAHNQWVQILVTGGVLLATIVLGLLVVAAIRAVRFAAVGMPWAAGWLGALLTVSVLEVPLGFVDHRVFWSATLVPLCLLICGEPDYHRRSPETCEEETSVTRDPTAGATLPGADLAGASPVGGHRG